MSRRRVHRDTYAGQTSKARTLEGFGASTGQISTLSGIDEDLCKTIRAAGHIPEAKYWGPKTIMGGAGILHDGSSDYTNK